ncbi:LysR family transcriptional regulator [Caulobacter zeae]|nr:LysR family transcriptional regulator [Caulobacter zeae]
MLEWDDLRSFLAIARHGNLSAAARALKVTQTTMGRRLEGLHAKVGARLLQRTPTGFVLTPAGERVLASVERMEAEALFVERAVTGEDAKIAGQVRITTVESFGARILTPLLKPLLDRQPELEIELITDTRSLSLSRREADVALRLAEFEQHEAVVRRVGDMAFGLYASPGYLEARGQPDLAAGSPGHASVTLQEDLALLPEARTLAQVAREGHVALRANSREAQLQAALAGFGLTLLPCYLALEQNLIELPLPEGRLMRGIWLGVHRDTRHTPRIRLVLDQLGQGLRERAEVLNPPTAPATQSGPAGT